jgi:Flp pilus assembly protein TadG
MQLKPETFLHRTEGTVAIFAALALPALVGFVAIVGEFGHGLLVKTENQRVADHSAYAAGLAYSSTSQAATMLAVAKNVAALNGISPDDVTAVLTVSPRTPTNQAVKVTIATSHVMLLAPVLKFGQDLPVAATAYAEVSASPSACILALSASGAGVSLSGGTTITAKTCTVASNASVSVPCGTSITAKGITYNSSPPSQGCSGISGSISKKATPDPLAANAGVVSASARARANLSLTGPSAPTVTGGGDIVFGWDQAATKSQAQAAGCTATFNSSKWTMACPSGGTYAFGSLSLAGGINVDFNLAASASTTYRFSGSIINSGATLAFGPGRFNVAKGIRSGGGSTTSFGAGIFNVGRDTTNCGGASAAYSICNTGTAMSFAGPSDFTLSSGIYNNGGSTLTLGGGTTNSFNIGAATDGNAINIGGGATTVFGDALGANSVFQMVGHFYGGGGSCTTIGAAINHDVKGNINAAAGLILGSGLYAVSGYVAIGANGGGSVSCNGTTVGVSGVDVTLAMAGSQAISGGSCNGFVFCIGGGFDKVTLSAPTAASSPYKNLVLVGPTTSSSAAGASISEGASGTGFGGAFYFPNGPLLMSGGATIGNLAGQCLQIVATQVTLTGGTKVTSSNCFSGAASSAIVTLVQ